MASPWWVALPAVIASGVILTLTWRRLALLSAGRRVTLVCLRAGAVAALLLMAGNPTREGQHRLLDRPRVVVLVDHSASMSLKDAPGGVSRIAWATGLLRPGAPLADTLSKSDLATLLFADDVRPAHPPLPDVADGLATDLHSSLAAALRAFPGGEPSAIVALTDGAANRGPSRDELVAWVSRRRLPVYCLGVGSAARPPDAWVGRVDAPAAVRAATTATVRVGIGSRGLDGRGAEVKLQAEGMAGGRKAVTLTEGRTQAAAFTVKPEKPGLYRCTAQLGALPGEWTRANNSRTFFLRVIPGKLKLLFIAGQPSREYKFIRRVLDSLPDLRATCLVRKSGTGFWQDGDPPRPGARPPTGDALNAQDAVILCDAPAAAFTAGEVQRLADFVRIRGGGLGVLGGPDSFGGGGYGASPLAGPLGVSLGGEPTAYSPLAAKAQPTADTATLSPTSDIGRHEGFPGWSALPFLAGLNPVVGVKPGASVLLRSGQGQPLLVIQRHGLGRTLCWLSDSTYRWVLSKDATPASRQGHAAFWSGIVAWLTTPPNRSPVALETDRDTYESGDTARVIAHVSGPGFEPVSGAEVTVEVVGAQGQPGRLRLGEVAGAAGRYETGLVTGRAGKYTLRARAVAEAKELGRDTRQIVVETPRRELADPAQDSALLQAIAQASGGAYLPAERAADIGRVLRLHPTERTVRTQYPWARTGLGFAAFLLLAGLDWLLRRWWGVG